MKLKWITIAIALTITAGYTDIGIGVKGGLSLYKSQNDRSLDFYNDFRPAADIMVFCELGANKFLFHNIQLSYYQSGGKSSYQSTDIYGDATGNKLRDAIKLDYIGIGYGLEFKTRLLNILPYLSAGVSLDYLVNTKEEFGPDKSVVEIHTLDDSKFKKFNVRPFLTGGLEYKISRIAILAEYTFSYNVLPYYVQKKTATNDGIKYKTFGQFFNLGCRFDL
jgi:hypothetical protein